MRNKRLRKFQIGSYSDLIEAMSEFQIIVFDINRLRLTAHGLNPQSQKCLDKLASRARGIAKITDGILQCSGFLTGLFFANTYTDCNPNANLVSWFISDGEGKPSVLRHGNVHSTKVYRNANWPNNAYLFSLFESPQFQDATIKTFNYRVVELTIRTKTVPSLTAFR